MTTTILTPLDFSGTQQLERRLYRKKVLPIDSIDYNGRKIDFTRDYLQSIVNSFNDGAFDNVPLQFADANNGHTNDPERYRGDVVAMALEADGLYVTVSATPEGAKVLNDNSKLGVSARIVNSYARADGKHYPAAVQHVLATHDPRIPGLGPWSSVESFSNEDGSDTIDLTAETFGVKKTKSKSKRDKTVPNKDTATLSADELAKLRALLADLDSEVEVTDDTADDNDADDELTDAELAELIAEAEADTAEPPATPEPVTAGAGAELSNPADDKALELANANALELARVRSELDESKWSAEREKFIRTYGFTPKVMDLAKPALKGDAAVIELANGEKTNYGTVMRDVLTEVGKMVKLLDLSTETGSGVDHEPDKSAEAAARREETTKAFRAMMGN